MSQEVEARELSLGGSVEETIAKARPSTEIAEEQLAYARLLDQGMKVGMLGLIVTFGAYASGALSPFLPVEDLPKYWGMPVKQYLAATGIHPGWSWLGLVRHGDFANFLGIAFLAGVTIVCYLAIIPIFLRKKDRTYAWLAVAEVLVLLLAASGILGTGAH